MFEKGLNRRNPFEPLKDSVPFAYRIDTRAGVVGRLEHTPPDFEIQSQLETENYYIDEATNYLRRKKDNKLIGTPELIKLQDFQFFIDVIGSPSNLPSWLSETTYTKNVSGVPNDVDGFPLTGYGFLFFNKYGNLVYDVMILNNDLTATKIYQADNVPRYAEYTKEDSVAYVGYFVYGTRDRFLVEKKIRYALKNGYVYLKPEYDPAQDFNKIEKPEDREMLVNVGLRLVTGDGYKSPFFLNNEELVVLRKSDSYKLKFTENFFNLIQDYDIAEIEVYVLPENADAFIKAASINPAEIDTDTEILIGASVIWRPDDLQYLTKLLVDLPVKTFGRYPVFDGIFETANFLYAWRDRELFVSFPKAKEMFEIERYNEFEDPIKRLDRTDRTLIVTGNRIFSYDESRNTIFQSIVDLAIDDLKTWNDRIYILANSRLYLTNLYTVKDILGHKLLDTDRIEAFKITEKGELLLKLDSGFMFYDPDKDFLTWINNDQYFTPSILRLPVFPLGQPFGSGRVIRWQIVHSGKVSIKVYGDNELTNIQELLNPAFVAPLDEIIFDAYDEIKVNKGSFTLTQPQQFVFLDIFLLKGDDGKFGKVYNIFIETSQNRR